MKLLFASGGLFLAALSMRVMVVDDLAAKRVEHELSDHALASPGKAAMQLISMEHNEALGALIWLQMVQVLGGAERLSAPGVPDRLHRWADLASDADPKNWVVYWAGGVNLASWTTKVEASDYLYRKGEENLPTRWQFPYLLGYNAYFIHGKPLEASEHWLRSSKLPRVPHFVPSLVASSKFRGGAETDAIRVLQDLIPNMEEGPLRTDAEIRLKLLKSEFILRAYDQACTEWRIRTATKPSPAQLFESGAVKYPPEDLFGEAIWLDEDCRGRTAMIIRREDEAAQDIGTLKVKLGVPRD